MPIFEYVCDKCHKEFEELVFYGRGPWENYSDRQHSAQLGIYNQTVAEQFYPYIRPQETGTKSDLRWWRVVNKAGRGLEFTSNAPFSASALNYTIESLDEGLQKKQRHSQEIAQVDYTQVCVDKVQRGLACVNSWSAIPLPQYLIPYGDYKFELFINPIEF